MPMARESKRVAPTDWKWFGHAGHFICCRWCRFHLCTQVGMWLISTVGEYWPERSSREVHAQVYDPAWLAANKHRKGDDFDAAYMQQFGYEQIGCGQKYESSVFKAGKPCDAKGCKCGLPSLLDGNEVEGLPANDAGTARANHMKLCKKYARRQGR